jgi:hypothetical protein
VTIPKERKWADFSEDEVTAFRQKCYDVVKAAALQHHKGFCLAEWKETYVGVGMEGSVHVVDTNDFNNVTPATEVKFLCHLDLYGKPKLLYMNDIKKFDSIPANDHCIKPHS